MLCIVQPSLCKALNLKLPAHHSYQSHISVCAGSMYCLKQCHQWASEIWFNALLILDVTVLLNRPVLLFILHTPKAYFTLHLFIICHTVVYIDVYSDVFMKLLCLSS